MAERDWGQLTRRGFIAGLAVSVFALTEVAYNAPIPADPLWQRLLAGRIRKALAGQGELGSAPEAFAVAYVDAYGFSLNDPQLVQRFLLSTDAFSRDEDAEEPLAFVALYDPYVLPCYSPVRG